MGAILNCCQKDGSDKTGEITVEPPVKKEDTMAPTPAAGSAEHPEQFGDTDFDELFAKMKENSDKEISVRESRRDPAGSHAAKFYINE